MKIHLGTFFKAARLTQGRPLEELARLTGYDNIRKVAGKIACFERDGAIDDELLARLGDALGIDFPIIEVLLAQGDQKENYAVQRQDDGRYLTPGYLQWSANLEDAQRCDQDASEAIRGWLAGIGIKVTIISLSEASVGNFAQ